ncbi:hypothetical protein ACT91Q_06155 [Brevibacillus thermoruber]|jgi:hypothetical protein|uniref:Snapalysin n=1 Tax=Brevibacillus aydinogluensis TaxID=927786 RepID=A0AA48RG57_9BACL|nr:hypothetical protein [Brevibacillus aydinogluensis]CAJ1000780.1 hypothetical protein BSPP4475_00390 [Brevibacillus aydinogluensis]
MLKKKFYLITMCLLFVMLFQGGASASHPYDPKRHIESTHYNSVDEYFCIQEAVSSIDIADAYDRFKEVLYSRNYDGLGNDRIYFLKAGSGDKNCSELSSSELEDVKIRYYIKDDTSSNCGSSSYSCVARAGSVFVDGHYHYDYGMVYLRTKDYTSDHTINHETGHILGLIDGGPNAPYPSSCGQSIMHSKAYGCSTNYANPTADDLESIENEITGD